MTSSKPAAEKSAPVAPLDWAKQHGVVDLVYRSLATKLQKRRRRRQVVGAVVSALVLAAVVFRVAPNWRRTTAVSTASERRETLALQDGSVVNLNARTNLSTDFRNGSRIVRLSRGEAYFAVAKDAAHPFLVETPAGTIRVTGTKFDVCLAQDDAVITLVEGSITMVTGASSKEVSLRAGEQLQIRHAVVQTRALSSRAIENVLAWRSGRLALDDLTLGEAVARFANYHDRRISVAPAVADLRLGGSCPLDDLHGFLSFLKEALPVTIESGNGEIRIVSAGSPPESVPSVAK